MLKVEWMEREAAEVERAGGGQRKELLRILRLMTGGLADPDQTGVRWCDRSCCGVGYPEVKVEVAEVDLPRALMGTQLLDD